jgi:hypothetical protein
MPSLFSGLGATEDYRDESWAEGSFWTFRIHETSGDQDAINKRIARTQKLTPQSLRVARAVAQAQEKAQAAGREVTDEDLALEDDDLEFDVSFRETATKAELKQYSEAWGGDEFLFDEHGYVSLKTRRRYGPGEVVPCEDEFIDLLPPAVVERVSGWLEKKLRGRSADEQERFRGGAAGVAGPEGDRGNGQAAAGGVPPAPRSRGRRVDPAVHDGEGVPRDAVGAGGRADPAGA